MVKIDNNFNSEQPAPANQPSQTQTEPQSKSGLITTLGQLLPLAPFFFEQFTGQKVPAMNGTMAEIQTALLQIQTNLQTMVNNQQQLANRIANLENSAVQQLTSLTQQFQSFRLTHTKERKQIELHSNGSDFDKSRQYNPPQLENQEESY